MDQKLASNDSTGEWGALTGVHRQLSAAQLEELAATPAAEAAFGSDPYNQTAATAETSGVRPRRRSLDDMRALSEAIKNSSDWRREPK